MNTSLTLSFDHITAEDLPRAGGKGANLGEMTRAGFPVPPGFCLTTEAFQRFMAGSNAAGDIYAALDALAPDDVEGARQAGAQIRKRLSAAPIPPQVEEAIIAAWEAAGNERAYAVRSSATAEDLPTASFAGQQDTYLNVRGREALLQAVHACWVSLFTDRAILYRAQNGFDHREVSLSVVVQRMVFPDVSGILFTADPVSGHRQIISIDASYGLGEALVAGLVTPDLYQVDKRSKTIVETQIADKQLAIRPKPDGGTFQETLSDDLRQAQVLNSEQILQLADAGTRIEAHYGSPQDIEWCIEDGQLYIVQTRPITSLFPLPEPRPPDSDLRVYFSFGHAQVMTDPMPPMARSIWRIALSFGKPGAISDYNPYLCEAADRLYIDASPMLRLSLPKRFMPQTISIADPLIAQGLRQVIDRAAFKEGHKASARGVAHVILPLLRDAQKRLWFSQPEGTSDDLSVWSDAYLKNAQDKLAAGATPLERLKLVSEQLGTTFADVVNFMLPCIVAGFLSRFLLMRLSRKRADPADLDALMRGLIGNVTTEMDLQVGDLADVARRSPELVRHLSTRDAVTALETAGDAPGGDEFIEAWNDFLARYGMRGPSEIDISRPRWRDEPASLLQAVVGNLQHQETGKHRARYSQLAAAGEAAGERLIAAARGGLFGPLRAALTRRMVRVARNLLAVREHPKFLLSRVMALVKQDILEAADALRAEGRIDHIDDIWFLDLLETIAALENPVEDLRPRIARRKANFERSRHIKPPRIITSDGEIPLVKRADANLPEGAMPGNPVSAGVVEGIARVITDPAKEILSPGEILVAPFTDPGWTPLFINAAGLVMEVGGLMTHGSVVAREYGIPAVVGVLDATRHIETGQRIRVNGNLGYVEIIEDGV